MIRFSGSEGLLEKLLLEENTKMKTRNYFLFLTMCFAMVNVKGQNIDLTSSFENGAIKIVNRTAFVETADEKFLLLNAKEDDGLAILKEVKFEKGSIELYLKGENNPGESFVGLAFNIQNDSTYEAVYFRPFNFVGKKQVQRDHMVQYIYHPEFPWHKLREERTGEFENELDTPPNPDDWFHVSLEIQENKIKVFVNWSEEPQLTVERLAEATSDKIGLWVGNGSRGGFKNLRIQN